MHPNPFSRDIVRNPQDSLVTVITLNQPVLDSLSAAFAPLVQAPAPRPAVPVPKAQLVLSPAPGFGKSHLIARLFADLGNRATVISFSPFETAGLCWQSLLWQVVKALHSPAGPSGKTRLAFFAEDVFRHLLAQALREGRLQHEHPAEAINWVLNDLTVEPPDDRRNWNPWMHETFLRQSAIWRAILAGHQIQLEDDAWLTVLFRYAASTEYSDQQQHCLAWLRGQHLSSESRDGLGLSAHPAPGAESASVETMNDLCRQRLHDLCRLAAFHRPFLFCFDQTEVFAQNEILARTFGRVVAGLVNELPQQMTVVTANQGVWEQKIRHSMDEADFHRFQTALNLKELNRQEGEELIALLTRSRADQAVPLARVTDTGWLASQFPTAGSNMPAREFLHRCQRRWDHAGPEPASPSITSITPAASSTEGADTGVPQNRQTGKTSLSLESRFEELRLPLAANPKALSYDPDVFRWLTGTALARPEECGPVEHSGGFAEIVWRLPHQAVLRFGFAHAPSDSYSLWRQLAEYAQENERRDLVPVSKLILFRTPDLQHCPIPRDSWKANAPAIRSARATCLHLIELTPAETAEIQAARQLHLEAQAGGFEDFSAGEVLDFLAGKLSPWRARLLAPLNAASGPALSAHEVKPAHSVPQIHTVRQLPVPDARPAADPAAASRPAPEVTPAARSILFQKIPAAGKTPLPLPHPQHPDTTPATAATPDPAAALAPRILEILKTEKFFSLEALAGQLGGSHTSSQVLEACRALREIEIQSTPVSSCTLLIWQG